MIGQGNCRNLQPNSTPADFAFFVHFKILSHLFYVHSKCMDYFGWVNIALILCSPRGIENNVGNWLNICVHKIPLKAMKPSVARVLI